jgi:hypothetical protein
MGNKPSAQTSQDVDEPQLSSASMPSRPSRAIQSLSRHLNLPTVGKTLHLNNDAPVVTCTTRFNSLDEDPDFIPGYIDTIKPDVEAAKGKIAKLNSKDKVGLYVYLPLIS